MQLKFLLLFIGYKLPVLCKAPWGSSYFTLSVLLACGWLMSAFNSHLGVIACCSVPKRDISFFCLENSMHNRWIGTGDVLIYNDGTHCTICILCRLIVYLRSWPSYLLVPRTCETICFWCVQSIMSVLL